MHKSINDPFFKILDSDREFIYEPSLTNYLDEYSKEFDQDLINQIVLWKVGRFANIDSYILKLINAIDPLSKQLDVLQTTELLHSLLKTKGIGLPMASTILRFKNPNIYQIIDQRVYRLIYPDQILKLVKTTKNIPIYIDLYLQYLNDLRRICEKNQISFNQADRVLFMADKRINKHLPIKY